MQRISRDLAAVFWRLSPSLRGFISGIREPPRYAEIPGFRYRCIRATPLRDCIATIADAVRSYIQPL